MALRKIGGKSRKKKCRWGRGRGGVKIRGGRIRREVKV